MKVKKLLSIILLLTCIKISAQYTDPTINSGTNTNNKFFISNLAISNVNNSNTNAETPYMYYSAIADMNLQLGQSYTGSITFETFKANDAVSVKIWIDYSGDGADFADASEEIFSYSSSSHTQTVTEPVSFTVPTSYGFTGIVRMRVVVKDNSSGDATAPTATTINGEEGEYEDYDVNLTPSPFESAMISQVYHSGTDERWIEITNNSASDINANTLILALYQNKSGDQTGVTPDQEYTVTSAITANSTILIRKNTSAVVTHTGTPIEEANITAFDGGDDILIITDTSGSTAWANRYDVVSSISDETSYVRNDNISTFNTTYTATEWTAFVDDALTEFDARHPNDPLLSEINSSSSTDNIRLGNHAFGSTSRTGSAWSNGTPDRTREVNIDEDYSHTGSTLNAATLNVNSSFKLTITDNALLVTNDVNINSTAEVRLAGTSQLIQTHTGAKSTSGTGNIYIDQNSTTTDVYRYNYFSSPVVSNTTDYDFSVADVMKDGTTATSAVSTHANIVFVNTYDGSTGPLTISNEWIYTLDPNVNASDYTLAQSSGRIEATNGFTIKGPGAAQNYTFIGVPKDGVITTTIGADESYLLGNPYPSAIQAEEFINDNSSSIDGTLYLWEHVGTDGTLPSGHEAGSYIGGYATLNDITGVAADNVVANNQTYDGVTPFIGAGTYQQPLPYIAVGQGFFVSGDVDGGTIEFNNSQRKYETEGANSVFLKTKKIKTINNAKNITDTNLPTVLKIGMDYKSADGNTYHSQIAAGFSNDYSFDYEKGKDAFSYNYNATRFSWKFENNDDRYIITGVPNITESLEVPFEVVIGSDGEIIFDLDEWQNINQEIYILDKQTNTTQALVDNGFAKFNLEPGTYTDRFAVAFKEHETLSNQEIIKNTVKIKYNNINNSLIIQNPNNTNISTIDLFNTLGRKIKSWDKASNLTLDKKINKGVYIVKVNTDTNYSISKKLVID